MTDPTPCTRDWVDVLSALLTPTIAFLGIYIALQQWRTNRARLKHELFDRRWEQYVATKGFLSLISLHYNDPKERQEFLTRTRGARFIFDNEIGTYMKEVNKKALDLQKLESKLKVLLEGEERSESLKKDEEIRKWCEKQIESIDDRFEPYLKLEHFRWTPSWILWVLRKIRIRDGG